jgi:phenylalanyl-tRNA synthetase beta chain
MLYSHDWLRTIVPHARSADEVARLIGRHVATVDDLRAVRQDLAPIVVARVVHVARHPNSDHLWVTRVDDGSGELLDVVCGAPNVVEGTLYPFARVGTVMPSGNKDGTLIEKRKIRGEWSSGMLCSARELGIGEEYDGIMPLDIDVPTGTPLLSALPLSDVQLDVDVLPNRPDLLSHLGLARELAALTGTVARGGTALVAHETGTEPAAIPPAVAGEREAISGGVHVRLEDPEGCPRYLGVVIRGVQVGPSPDWLVKRLAAVGSRSISNVVDASNYILHALGQPTHAFDLARLAGGTVVIRRASAGERLVTLDGVDRALTPDMTVIADAERAIAVAGVMGGRDSEVTASTTEIFLEVAWFDPRRVRRTRRSLGLATEASHRFERGVDPGATWEALMAAAQLIIAVAGGRIDGAPLETGMEPARTPIVRLDVARAERLLGAPVASAEAAALLRGIGFGVEGTGAILHVSPPSWRPDVSRDADLVEELARLRGFDTLSDELLPFRPGRVPDHPFVRTTRALQELLAGSGLLEARSMPFVHADDATHVRVRNPLGEDEPHLRRGILETLARRAEHNLSRMEGNVRLFEIGAVFEKGTGRLPAESLSVGALLMGARRPPHFTEPRPPSYDEWDARGLAERIANVVSGSEATLVPGSGGDDLWTIQQNGEIVGRVCRVVLDRPVWASQAFGVELRIGPMASDDVAVPGAHADGAVEPTAHVAHAQYRTLPVTPAAEFDLALVLPPGMSADRVEASIRSSAGPLLERLTLFDEFRGAGLAPGERSVGWRLTFRDPSRTLRDKEVEGRRARILQTLEKELGIRPRSA